MKKLLLVFVVFLFSIVGVFGIGGYTLPEGGGEPPCGDGICQQIYGCVEGFECEPVYYDGDSCPADCTAPACDSCCAPGFPTRAGVDDFCREDYGFIRLEDCPDPICIVMSESDCIGNYSLFKDCPEFEAEAGTGGYARCDSCCNGDDDCPFPWWLLVIGGVVGWFVGKRRRR